MKSNIYVKIIMDNKTRIKRNIEDVLIEVDWKGTGF